MWGSGSVFPLQQERQVAVMLKNNNRRVIGRMAGRALKGNRGRSLVLFTAIALSSFMLFTVLNAGAAYVRMWRQQDLRLNGAEYDAVLYGCSTEQMEQLRENADIVRIGIMGLAGWMEESQARLVWVNDVFWEQMAAPARTSMEGHYPAAVDEVMVTKKALERAGLDGCGVGDCFTAVWTGKGGRSRQTDFRISGIWDGYGITGAFFVSEEFYKSCGFELSDLGSGRVFFDLRQKLVTRRQQEALTESLALTRRQRLLFMVESGFSVPLFLGLSGLILVVCFCAYLLICNIMSLSVSGNIRCYGLLQTVGMTGRQIRGFLYRQMLVLWAGGTAAGILAGTVVAFLLLPSLIAAFGIEERAEVEFQPEVLFLTIVLAAVTVFSGSRKPAKMAAQISPVEASRYFGAGAADGRITERWSVLWRMGGRKAFGNPKKTAIIMLSLSAGLSVFLCVTTLLQSQGARTIVSNAWGEDMEIRNETLQRPDRTKRLKLLDGTLSEELGAIPGVRDVRTVKTAEIMIPWESGFADRWMREFYRTWMEVPYESELENYRNYPENFSTYLVGVEEADLPLLQEGMEQPLDEADFLAGRTCVLYGNELSFQTEDLLGETVRCAAFEDGEHRFSFAVGGLTTGSAFLGPVMGYTPTVIVSRRAFDALKLPDDTYRIRLAYDREYDAGTEEAVLSLLESRTELRHLKVESRLLSLAEMKEAQGNMPGVGIGISLILALIGVMNYVNTVTGNIESRRKELAILESIGMTRRQMNRMLVREGAVYAVGAFLLTLVTGLPATYGLYEAVNYNQVPFFVPAVPILLVLAAVFLICVGVPVVLLHGIGLKGSVVERIRERGD